MMRREMTIKHEWEKRKEEARRKKEGKMKEEIIYID